MQVCCTAGGTPTPGCTAPPTTRPTTSSWSAWRTWWAQISPSAKHTAASPATGSPSSSTGPAAPATTSGRRRWAEAPGNVVFPLTSHLSPQQVQESPDVQYKSGDGDKDAEYHRHVRHTALSLIVPSVLDCQYILMIYFIENIILLCLW